MIPGEGAQKSLGREIASVEIKDEQLRIAFTDGSRLIVDDQQVCCEARYMRTDDDLDYYAGATLLDMEIEDGPTDSTGEYGEALERQFLHVRTSRGSFVVSNHNEHNGYYGGFCLAARLESAPPASA